MVHIKSLGHVIHQLKGRVECGKFSFKRLTQNKMALFLPNAWSDTHWACSRAHSCKPPGWTWPHTRGHSCVVCTSGRRIDSSRRQTRSSVCESGSGETVPWSSWWSAPRLYEPPPQARLRMRMNSSWVSLRSCVAPPREVDLEMKLHCRKAVGQLARSC